ncbi:DUF5362 family protein [Mucilaginibacter pedocola]|uniref:DUF5362 domain-containing protein n=1 Tax=Mucilaginibacter pedocola TaxID=1792845 RepID=A0A1S9PJA7_9SPHI|nr:DUF5362 family protein [Mucilaginibacter pedocola]OOQ61033.1 hypothetical protein BC343_21525 [Mucilaginibacter pedocola]
MDTTHFPDAADEPQLLISIDAKQYLQTAGKWATFLGIVGFIMTGLVAVMALFIGAIFAAMAQFNPMMAAIPAGVGTLLTVVYLLMALLSFFFALYLFQFGSRVKKAIAFNDTAEAALAFSKLKSFFKLWGIITIVVFAFYILAFAFGIVAGIAGAAGAHA